MLDKSIHHTGWFASQVQPFYFYIIKRSYYL